MALFALGTALDRQFRSRLRSGSYWAGAFVPVTVISALLYQTAKATESPATVVFLAALSALWVGGSSCVREIVDERKLIEREPHLHLLHYGLSKILYAALLVALQSAVVAASLSLSDVVVLPVLRLWLILFLTSMAGAVMAMVLSALCDEASTALAWFPLLLVPQVVFAGFLFPYATTKPFAFEESTRAISVMPEPLVRKTVSERALRLAGAACVSRWALEAYAAEVFEQDLADSDRFQEAVQVAFFVPLTLTDEKIGEVLLNHVVTKSRMAATQAPKIDAKTGNYRAILAAFVVIGSILLLAILGLRDPRRR